MAYAPIVLFVYNRPWHTQQTMEALSNNVLAEESELFIFSDGSKTSSTQEEVDEVRKIIRKFNGFKKVTIIEQKINIGLANSIINGVTELINKYGKIIVMEDDIVTSPGFLKYINEALDYYEEKNDIWHISGWNYPIDPKGLQDVFLWRGMECWGWATWANRWKYFEKSSKKLISEFGHEKISQFNLDGYKNTWKQIIDNDSGSINTWAVFWYATIFRNKGLSVNPTRSFVRNIGIDGSGVHCGDNDVYQISLNSSLNIKFVDEYKENEIAVEKIKLFYKKLQKNILIRIINKINRILFKVNLI
jgi:hypothetical protein